MQPHPADGTHTLRAARARLSLAPAQGGRLAACSLECAGGGSVEVLRPLNLANWSPDRWPKAGLFPLVPYSGRLRNATLAHAGHALALRPHEGSPHSLHGIAQRRAWTLQAHGPADALMRLRHQADADWPWDFDAWLRLSLEPRRLRLELGVCNRASGPMSAGIGLHPYLAWGPQDRLQLRAAQPWPYDADYLACDRPPSPDLHDHAWGPEDLAAGELTRFFGRWAGTAVLHRPHGRLLLSAGGALDQLVVHRPAGMPYLCVEPVSHVADGFNLFAQGVAGTGTRMLGRGDSLDGRLELRWED